MANKPPVILLADDNPHHIELIVRSFAMHKIVNQIFPVSDGQEALDYLFRRGRYTDPESSPWPHMILLDLRLPKLDGIQVLRTIKTSEHLRRIPVVIVTSSMAERDVLQAYDNHANGYVVKPVDFTKFTQMIRELGTYWLHWNTTTGRSDGVQMGRDRYF